MPLNIIQMQTNALPPARHKLTPFSILRVMLLFYMGKTGKQKSTWTFPMDIICAAGSSNRVPAEAEAGMSGRYLELVLTEYGGETKTLAAQF